jgi:hypothetical protein
MLKRMGVSKKNITVMQNIISETIGDFKYKISSDNESEGEKYHPVLNKSENDQPLTSRNQNQKQNLESDESEEKSNQRMYKSTFDNQYMDQK